MLAAQMEVKGATLLLHAARFQTASWRRPLRARPVPTIRFSSAEIEQLRIVITGASGSIGRPLVKDFIARGAELLLVGRDPNALRTLFPGASCCSYDDLSEVGRGYDGLLHLAVLNNNAPETADAFLRANVDLTQTVLQAAHSAGIERLVYASTVQSLDSRNQSPYAASKRAATELVAGTEGLDTRILHLAAVVGDRLTGRLALLDRLPLVLSKPLLEDVCPSGQIDV
ncbi:MAG: NAD(P)-dependent oxidoreductase [Verrucomicrobiaceae bacterium]|nr:MAG: NAD(P)-dependent oxidoreductase [Verrucomicrobiaceae bacterium]